MRIEMPDINKIRKEIDKKNAEMEKKERERIEEEYERLSGQENPTEETPEKKSEEKSEEKVEEKSEKKEGPKEKKVEKEVEEKKKEKLEKEITEKYYDELEKTKQMPDNTGDNRNLKAKKYFELINDWKNVAYLDNYKGIQNIFSELNKSKPSIFLYNWKKAETIDEIAIAMASNYEKWGLKDKKKLKIIKSFVNEQSKEKNLWYGPDDKDAILKEITQILALKDIPFKGSLDIIIKDIENPNIKAEAMAQISDIERGTIEEKKKLLKEIKEKMAKEKMPSEEKIKEQFKKMGVSSVMEKILQDPEALSKLFHEAFEISKNPEVQEKFQELQDIIKKTIKGKEEVPDSVAKAAESIKGEGKGEKKDSSWKTGFETMGLSILLFLVLFMLLELKGIDYFSGQAAGKKKEKK